MFPNCCRSSCRSSVLQQTRPYSPLFSTAMYVRPDSDKLPKYLANSGVKFCGHGRSLSPVDSMNASPTASTDDSMNASPTASTDDSMNASPTASTDAFSMQRENKWKETGYAETWASGFLMGVAASMVFTAFVMRRGTTCASTNPRTRPAVDA
jgi:hypothetical protein